MVRLFLLRNGKELIITTYEISIDHPFRLQNVKSK